MVFILKFGLVDMTTRFEILRPVSEDDLHTAPRIIRVLKQFPAQGRLANTEIKDMGVKATVATRYACEKGILRRIPRFEELKKLETVRFWSSQPALRFRFQKHAATKLHRRNIHA